MSDQWRNRINVLREWSGRQGARLAQGTRASFARLRAWPWTRIGVWTGGAFGVLAMALVLFLTFADWNALRGPISRMASALAACGRIHGRRAVSKTSGSPRKHIPEWMQRSASKLTAMSLEAYSRAGIAVATPSS